MPNGGLGFGDLFVESVHEPFHRPVPGGLQGRCGRRTRSDGRSIVSSSLLLPRRFPLLPPHRRPHRPRRRRNLRRRSPLHRSRLRIPRRRIPPLLSSSSSSCLLFGLLFVGRPHVDGRAPQGRFGQTVECHRRPARRRKGFPTTPTRRSVPVPSVSAPHCRSVIDPETGVLPRSLSGGLRPLQVLKFVRFVKRLSSPPDTDFRGILRAVVSAASRACPISGQTSLFRRGTSSSGAARRRKSSVIRRTLATGSGSRRKFGGAGMCAQTHGIVFQGSRFWVTHRRRRYGPFDYEWSKDFAGIELSFAGDKFGEYCGQEEIFADLKTVSLARRRGPGRHDRDGMRGLRRLERAAETERAAAHSRPSWSQRGLERFGQIETEPEPSRRQAQSRRRD